MIGNSKVQLLNSSLLFINEIVLDFLITSLLFWLIQDKYQFNIQRIDKYRN